MDNHDGTTEPIFVQHEHGRPRPRWSPPAMTAVDFTSATHSELPPMRTWIATFDLVWRDSVHPTPLPNARRCHPDGFVAIRSRGDEDAVASIAATLLGRHYLEVLLLEALPDGSMRRFPLGCLATYDATLRHWIGAS